MQHPVALGPPPHPHQAPAAPSTPQKQAGSRERAGGGQGSSGGPAVSCAEQSTRQGWSRTGSAGLTSLCFPAGAAPDGADPSVGAARVTGVQLLGSLGGPLSSRSTPSPGPEPAQCTFSFPPLDQLGRGSKRGPTTGLRKLHCQGGRGAGDQLSGPGHSPAWGWSPRPSHSRQEGRGRAPCRRRRGSGQRARTPGPSCVPGFLSPSLSPYTLPRPAVRHPQPPQRAEVTAGPRNPLWPVRAQGGHACGRWG